MIRSSASSTIPTTNSHGHEENRKSHHVVALAAALLTGEELSIDLTGSGKHSKTAVLELTELTR
jgi:hypothetical protein